MITMTYKDQRARSARAGFTLVEIMIAIAIIGLLMGLVVPAVNSAYKKAQRRTAKMSLTGLKNAITEYQRDTHQLPGKLKDLIKKPANITGWEEPYIEKEEVPTDPWGNDFKYKVTQGGKHPYELYSWGPNGQGAPKDEWINVWEEAKKE
jgi:general secretion pathway protein G